MKVVNFIKLRLQNMSKNKKMAIIALFIVIGLFISFAVPSLAKYKNRAPVDIGTVWDGTVASKYRSGKGTKEEPYIISDGSELAYLSTMLKETDYKDTYFKLSNNIVLNSGLFNYNGGILYTLNTTDFYLKEYTTDFYDNEEYTGVKISSINSFESLNNFSGYFDGDGYIIYGLYTYSEDGEAGLFTNLSGTVENLYLKNSMIYGGNISGGLASTTNDATLKNISNDGFVIGKDEGETIFITSDVTEVEKTVETTANDVIEVFTTVPVINGEVVSITLAGKLEKNTGDVLINDVPIITDANGNFEIELGNIVSRNINISYNNASNTTFKLTNLKYNIEYKQLVSGGIIGISNNTTLENIINKSQVYGNLSSGGIAGMANEKFTMMHAYNTGKIIAFENAGGIVGNINYNSKDISISKIYNTGEIIATNAGGIISNIKENVGNIVIQNALSIGNAFALNTISNSNVQITNSYITEGSSIKTGSSVGAFEISTKLYDQDYQLNTLLFNKFIDKEDYSQNSSNVWIYEKENLPILFIDELNNPIATLFVNTHSWNDLSYELSQVNYDRNITFSIQANSELRPTKEISYYISNSQIPLTKTEIENILDVNDNTQNDDPSARKWQEYTDIVQITEEGFYVIYVKIKDENDEITYLNSELLVLDLTNPIVSLKYGTYSWNTYKDSLENIYIDKEAIISMEYNDSYSGIKDILYYVSPGMLSINELNQIKNWIKYEENILINNIGSYIVYAKVIDNVGHATYVNTDVITYGGYSLNNIYAGRNLLTQNINITDKSEVTYNFTYSDSNKYQEGYTHNIVTNKVLPIGSKLILKDNINNKNYVYLVNEEKNIIPFVLFKEIGTDTEIYFKEEISEGVNENYSIVLDLFNTNIEANILDLKLHLAIYDSDSIKVRTTLENTIKGINIYVDNSKPYISTSYVGNTISYDSNSTTSIPLNAGIRSSLINLNKIYDTIIEDKILGITIKIVDAEGNVVNKKYLKNIKYSISDTYYPIDDDGIARINLNNGINDFNDNLIISTELDNSELQSGTYYFKISSYVSYDGKYSSEYSEDVVTIPVTNKTTKVTYSFDVLLDNSNRLVSNEEENTTIHFDILQKGPFYNPNIRVSLYKKKELTAYDQSYTLIDLNEYVTNNLESITDKIYYASKYPYFYTGYKNSYNTLDLELINSKFENTGYKFVFELYDGNKKIGTIEKKIIVK